MTALADQVGREEGGGDVERGAGHVDHAQPHLGPRAGAIKDTRES
jgi:hypothetical protein